MNTPKASIIIPTYNRVESLRETLASLAQQTESVGIFEVIIVDDGSTDDTESIADECFPFELHYIRQANQGSAVARNTGAKHAQGEILIFLDDDILAEPEYVTELIEEHQTYPRIVAMGKELPYIPPDPTVFAKLAAHNGPTGNNVDKNGAFVDFTACVTNNISVERTDFFEIGMMQDVAGDGPTWWGDIDFGYRAQQLGFRFRRSGKAKCYHRDYSALNLASTSSRYYKASKMALLLFRKFPDLQTRLPMFKDKTPVKWREDDFPLIVRKVIRSLISSRLIISTIEKLVDLLERYAPSTKLLPILYRWIVGGYIFRGYRDGMREYSKSAL